jgi:hypothetical protein
VLGLVHNLQDVRTLQQTLRHLASCALLCLAYPTVDPNSITTKLTGLFTSYCCCYYYYYNCYYYYYYYYCCYYYYYYYCYYYY